MLIPQMTTTHEDQNTESSLMLFLGRIDGKLDSALSRIERHEISHERLTDRVTLLERRWARIAGIAVGAGVGGAGFIKFVTFLLEAV